MTSFSFSQNFTVIIFADSQVFVCIVLSKKRIYRRKKAPKYENKMHIKQKKYALKMPLIKPLKNGNFRQAYQEFFSAELY